MAFRFTSDVRPIVKMLADATMACNNVNRLACQHDHNDPHGLGPYGFAYYGIIAIIRKEAGNDVAERVFINFGGNATYLDDVEVAVTEARQDIHDELLARHD